MANANVMLKPIIRWLQREPPPQCATLALICGGMNESNVQAWSRAEWEKLLVGDLAADALSMSEDHAQGIGRECRYFLRWLNEAGETVISTQWRAGEGLNLNLDGSVESQIAQLQRHVEAMAKLSSQGMSSLLDAYQEVLGAQAERIRSLEQVRDAFETERLIQVTAAKAEGEETSLSKLATSITDMGKVADALKAAKMLPADTKKGVAKAKPKETDSAAS